MAKPKDISADDLVGLAEQQLGKRYVFGTAGPNTFDCSGLVLWAIRRLNGQRLNHSAANQATLGEAVGRGSIQKGDLVFFNLGRGRNSHVGIATGPNAMIEAPNSRNPVRRTTLNAYYRRRITAVRRLSYVKQADEMNQNTPGAGLSPNGVPNGNSATRTRGGGSTTRTTPQGSPRPGGDPNGNSSWLDGVTNGIGSALTGAADDIDGATQQGGDAIRDNPIAGAADKLGQSVKDGLEPLTAITGVAEKITNLFLPTMLTRIVCGVIGLICIVSGCFLIIREGKNG